MPAHRRYSVCREDLSARNDERSTTFRTPRTCHLLVPCPGACSGPDDLSSTISISESRSYKLGVCTKPETTRLDRQFFRACSREATENRRFARISVSGCLSCPITATRLRRSSGG